MTDAPLLFFHDTSVLVNFHRPGLLPVLGQLLRQNVRWTATIRTECERQERKLSLPGLVAASEALLGEPLFPEGAEHAALRQLRTQMASPGDHRDEHLGEAETLTIIQKRAFHAVFVTDDGGAVAWADPIECVGTWKLIRLALRRGDATRAEAIRLWEAFVGAGGHPPHGMSSRDRYFSWLDGSSTPSRG